MSVLKRKRKLSELEFYNTLVELRVELTQFVMNEKNIPKRWRPVITFPITEKLSKCMDAVIKANTIYPTNQYELQRRKDCQVDALAYIEQIYQDLQFAFSVLNLNLNRLESILNKMDNERNLLIGWKKSNTKVMKSIREKNKKAKDKGEDITEIQVTEEAEESVQDQFETFDYSELFKK